MKLSRLFITLLFVMPFTTAQPSYDDTMKSHREEQKAARARSIANAKVVSIGTTIQANFFDDPLAPNETGEERLSSLANKKRQLAIDDEVARSLRFGGRVQEYLRSLLSSRLSEDLGIQVEGKWIDATHRIKIEGTVNQTVDWFGGQIFSAHLKLAVHEYATTPSGVYGSVAVETIYGKLSTATTKDAIERALYESFEDAYRQLVNLFGR